MTDTFAIRPAVARADLRDPLTGDVLADAGEIKPRSVFWLALLSRGDVVEGLAPDEPSASPDDHDAAVHDAEGHADDVHLPSADATHS